ncbi:response regulator [Pseudomonadota bacterium]
MGKPDESEAFPGSVASEGSKAVPGESQSNEISGTTSEVKALTSRATESGVNELRLDATVLFVDDESIVRRPLSRILERYGCKVYQAEDGESGLEIFRALSDEIDLVLVDVMMPKMNGDELLAEIRKINTSVPVVMTSGFDRDSLSAKGLGNDADGILEKPILSKALLDVIGSLIKGPRQK